MSVAENIQRVRERIAAAAHRAGRRDEEVALMAVSKTFPPDIIRKAYAAGLRLFGENRVQEFAAKAPSLQDLASAEWHMIGHLQSNKAAEAAELFSAVDSVDSLKLAQKLNREAHKVAKAITVLIEINVGGEPAKSGVAADSRELNDILEAAAGLESIRIRGLMTIPPFSEDAQLARTYFQRLRRLAEQIRGQNINGVAMDVLSMGMSHDFEVAIEEGSTCVRVGTAIFGERKKK